MSDPTLTAWWDFANQKTLASRHGRGPTMGIVRALNTASRFNSLGVMETGILANVARFDHHPVTGASLGLLIEEPRTHLLLQSQRPTLAPWTTLLTPVINETSVIAPDGTLTGISLNDNNGAGFEAILKP